jgi:SAM-dependent methyltransferase
MVDQRRSDSAKTGGIGRPGIFTPISRLTQFCGSLPDRAQGYAFDRFLGVSTKEPVITTGSVFAAGGENCPYSGAQWIPVRRALTDLTPGSADVFVDLGSGKGKVLLIAGRLPYQRAIGVEIDEDLSRHSQQNVQRAASRLRAQLVESVNASAMDWAIPDEVSVVFMFNPFIGRTFHSAIGNIFESYDRRPRKLHIVYQYPWEHDWLLSTNRVRVESVRPSSWPALPGWWQSGNVIVCYAVVGAAGDRASQPAGAGRDRGSRRAADHWSRPNGHRFAMGAPGQQTFYSPAG